MVCSIPSKLPFDYYLIIKKIAWLDCFTAARQVGDRDVGISPRRYVGWAEVDSNSNESSAQRVRNVENVVCLSLRFKGIRS